MSASLNVLAYTEALEQLRKVKADKSSVGVEDVLEDLLDELWLDMTVAEWEEIERRYPELRIRRFG